MKQPVKHLLYRFGIYTNLDAIRRLPEIVFWLSNGCTGIAPPPVKRKIIRSYLQHHGLKVFIETGTHLGDTLADIASDAAVQAISIELADNYYQAAAYRFAKYKNVELLHGDSGLLMAQVVGKLRSPALFWLDGHYSGGMTAKGDLETPVSAELQSILASPITGHVILIDDVRCFDGTRDYPHLDEFLAFIRADGRYRCEVSTDILRLTPR
jgi:hypothetical protein